MVEAVKSSGLRNVVAGESSISTIDGARGILSYRGIDIHELARHSTFEETTWLLHKGSLPTAEQLQGFRAQLARERAVPDGLLSVLRALPRGAHPMTSLRTAVSALGGLDPEAGDDTLPASSRTLLSIRSPWNVNASSAPSSASRRAIAHAIERLFATPRTRPRLCACGTTIFPARTRGSSISP